MTNLSETELLEIEKRWEKGVKAGDFITHACADLPALLSTVREILAELEADARRYRWLRDWAQSYQMHEWFKSGLSLQQIDAAIDKAIASNKHLTPPKDQTP